MCVTQTVPECMLGVLQCGVCGVLPGRRWTDAGRATMFGIEGHHAAGGGPSSAARDAARLAAGAQAAMGLLLLPLSTGTSV